MIKFLCSPIIEFSYFNSKSISRLILLGSIKIDFFPSLNSIVFSILITLIGDKLFLIPVFVIASTNNFAEPSKIGISKLLTSIKALSIPMPYSAPIKCSIVETLTPCSFEIVVQKFALLTLKTLGIKILLLFISVLLKTIPELGSEGLIVRSAFKPL